MRLLVDVGVGRSVERWLASQGQDVVAVRDLDARMSDAAILALAVRERRLVITMDKDFGEMIFRSGKEHAGVLLLRLEDAPSEKKLQVVRHLFTLYGDSLPGRFCVYQRDRLRVREARGSKPAK